MTFGERIKKVRKAFDLTQQEFADKIGSKRNTVATYEMGRTDPSAAVISLICREFHVNETWLRTGEGEMFNQEAESTIDRLCAELEANELDAEIIRAYFRIDPGIRHEFMTRLIQVVHKDFSLEPASQGVIAPEPVPSACTSQKDLEAEADEYAAMAREQYLSQRKRELEASSAKESDVG